MAGGLSFAVVWTALWLFTGGTMAVYVAVSEKRADLPWGWTMVLGVLTIAFGVLALMYPGLTLAGLISLIAAVGIVGGSVMLAAVAKLSSFERDVTDTVRPAAGRVGR
jgi:uncharacterized membrane protein HdeD (DUF308 family)